MPSPPTIATMYVKALPSGSLEFQLLNVNVTSYHVEPVFAEDGITSQGASYRISGTCLFNSVDWEAFRAGMGAISTRLQYAQLRYPPPAVEKFLINLNSSTSSWGAPVIKLTGTEVLGANVVLGTFELSDDVAICEDINILSHRWVQGMSFDAAGHATRTVNGSIKVNRGTIQVVSTIAEDNSYADRKPWADIFRRAIRPYWIGNGWRREMQDFVYDQSSAVLVYQFVDKQYALDLPDGCRVGDMDFTYERNAQDAGVANVSVTVDLEGDLSFNGTDSEKTGNRRLIEAAIRLSQARIDASFKSVLITRMRVTERGLMSGYKIRFELDAMVFPSAAPQTGASPPLATVTALAFMVGRRFYVKRLTNPHVDPYGPLVTPLIQLGIEPSPAVQFVMQPHWFGNDISGSVCDSPLLMPSAYAEAHVGTPTFVDLSATSVTVTVVNDSAFMTSTVNTLFDGYQKLDQQQLGNNPDGYIQIVTRSHSSTQVEYDTGLIHVSPMYNDQLELSFQVRKPCVRVTERMEVTQANSPPARTMRAVRTGSLLISEDWKVSFGNFDAQGQRVYTGIYERVYELRDTGTANGFSSVNYSATGTVRVWHAPFDLVLPALGSLATNASQSSTVDAFGLSSTVGAYPVPAPTFVT